MDCLHFGKYETFFRDYLDHAVNIHHYQSALNNELFDIIIMERKAHLQNKLLTLLVSEPDARLIKIGSQSPWAIRPEALEFIENNMNSFNLHDPRSHYDKVLVEQTLRYCIQDAQRNGHRSAIYKIPPAFPWRITRSSISFSMLSYKSFLVAVAYFLRLFCTSLKTFGSWLGLMA